MLEIYNLLLKLSYFRHALLIKVPEVFVFGESLELSPESLRILNRHFLHIFFLNLIDFNGKVLNELLPLLVCLHHRVF